MAPQTYFVLDCKIWQKRSNNKKAQQPKNNADIIAQKAPNLDRWSLSQVGSLLAPFNLSCSLMSDCIDVLSICIERL